MMMHYAGLLTKWNNEKTFMSTALLQGRDGECHLKNTCKFLAAGDSIFLLTFNLLFMLVLVYRPAVLMRMDALRIHSFINTFLSLVF
jgi:hypothetical protein